MATLKSPGVPVTIGGCDQAPTGDPVYFINQSTQKYVYPVIHHLDWQTTYVQATLALDAGADGVFLISHRGDDLDLLEIAVTLKAQHSKFVGINFLGHDAPSALLLAAGIKIDGMWCDAPGVSSTGITLLGSRLRHLHNALRPVAPQVFASVAFKYQPTELNPAEAAINAAGFGYIPTTSGPGTGQAPDLEKIQLMSEAVHGNLAIASGMTPENVSQFLPYVKYFLVATGISKDENHFDPIRMQEFINRVHQFKA